MANAEARESHSVLAERLGQVLLHEPAGLAASAINAVILAYVQWPHVPRWHAAAWLATVFAVIALRLCLRLYLRRHPATPGNARTRAHQFRIGVAISGAVWGAAALLLFPAEPASHRIFTAFVVGGMVAGAAAAYSPLQGAYAAFAAPALLPLLLRFAMQPGQVHLSMAFMILLFGLLVGIISRRIQTMTWSSFALRSEKQGLVDTLSHAVAESKALNEHLREEIRQRRNTERELQRHREQLEAAVESRTAELSRANRELAAALSEKTRVEASLRESEQKHRSVVDNAREGIFVIQDGTVRFANPAARSLMGLYPGGKAPHFPQDAGRRGPAESVQAGRGGRRGGEAPGPSLLRLDAGGRECWVEMDSIPVVWEGRSAILCFARDMTERRRLEDRLQLVRKMESLGTLAGGVAHDFNNLLMGIGGQVSLMLSEAPSGSPLRERLLNLEGQIRSGADSTRQLLGLAMGGRYEIRPTDLNRLVRQVALVFGRTHKEIVVRERLEEGVWPVEADQGQIEQVLLDICLNAWQAMPEGGSVTFITRKASISPLQAETWEVEPGDFAVVDIEDTGIGMDRQVLRRIFDPFFTTRGMGNAAGLGLASAYGVIRNHGGFIEVSTEKGKGSTFSLHLPRSRREFEAAAEGGAAEGGAGGAAEGGAGGRTVLLVEDEELVAGVAKQMLEKLGFRVRVAANGPSAIETYRQLKPGIDLVLLDMVLPGMDGEAIFRHLKELDPAVRVLISSGFSVDERIRSLLRGGCLGFIPKPYNMAELARKLAETLDPPPEKSRDRTNVMRG